MGCNCKKIKNVMDTHGEPVEMSLLEKVGLFFKKIFYYLMTILIRIVVIPVVVVICIYKALFSHKPFILDKPLSKFLV